MSDDDDDEFIRKIREAAKTKKQNLKTTTTTTLKKFNSDAMASTSTKIESNGTTTTTKSADGFFKHAVAVLKKDSKLRQESRENFLMAPGETIDLGGVESATVVNGTNGNGYDRQEDLASTSSAASRTSAARSSRSTRSTTIAAIAESLTTDGVVDLSRDSSSNSSADEENDDDDDVITLDDSPEAVENDESIEIADESNKSVTIRIKVEEGLQRFTIGEDEKMETIFKALAQQFGISIVDVKIYRTDEVAVHSSDTPRSLELGYEILDFVRGGSNAVKANSSTASKRKAEDPNLISIKFQTNDRKCAPVEILVNKLDNFEVIKSMYVTERELDESTAKNLKFMFDGDRIVASNSPADLDMEDGDCIDVEVIEVTKPTVNAKKTPATGKKTPATGKKTRKR